MIEHLFRCPLHTPAQAGEQQPNHCHLDQRFARLHLPLIILAHSSIARDPTEGTLHHPSTRYDAEASGAWGTLHDFQLPFSCRLAPLNNLPSAIRRVCPDFFETGDEELEPCKRFCQNSEEGLA